MGVLSWVDAEIVAGPYRLTGRSNNVDLELTAAELDCTNFDSGGWMEMIGGIKSAAVSVDGFYDAAALETGALTLDEQAFTELGTSLNPLTVAPTKADGSVAYVTGYTRGSLSFFGQVGDVAPFSSDLFGDSVVGRGFLIHPANTTETGGGTGTGQQLGAASATQSVVIAVQVVSLSGTSPSLDVTVESDDNAGFTSATTVLNTGAITTPTGTLSVVAGPATDDYYRCTWTLSGTSPVARFSVAVGLTP